MTRPVKEPDAPHTPQEIGAAFAAQLGNKPWQLDAADLLLDPGSTADEPPAAPEESSPVPEVPLAEAAVEPEVPPSPLQIIEAMLFIGGQPLKPERACQI